MKENGAQDMRKVLVALCINPYRYVPFVQANVRQKYVSSHGYVALVDFLYMVYCIFLAVYEKDIKSTYPEACPV